MIELVRFISPVPMDGVNTTQVQTRSGYKINLEGNIFTIIEPKSGKTKLVPVQNVAYFSLAPVVQAPKK